MRAIYVAFLIVAIGAIPLSAAIVELEPSKDAYVCSCAPDGTNPAGAQYLGQGRVPGPCYLCSFIQWDFSELDPDETINSAELHLYVAFVMGAPNGDMTYTRTIEDWGETSVTWRNQPDYSDDYEVILYSWPTTGSWHIVDLTDLVVDWYEGTIDNYGVRCFGQNHTRDGFVGFASTRYPSEDARPKLVVDYTGGAEVDEASWGVIKEAFEQKAVSNRDLPTLISCRWDGVQE